MLTLSLMWHGFGDCLLTIPLIKTMPNSKWEEIKSRVVTPDGEVLNGEAGKKYVERHRKKVIATTESEAQKKRLKKKQAMIKKYGEDRYNELASEHGAKILKD